MLRKGRLKWLRHVLRKDDGDWVKKVMAYEVDGVRERGRPKNTWSRVVDAVDRVRWRQLLKSEVTNPCVSGEDGRKTAVSKFVIITAFPEKVAFE